MSINLSNCQCTIVDANLTNPASISKSFIFIFARKILRCATLAKCGTSADEANTPLNPLLVEGTLREEKKRKCNTPLNPLLVEGTLREEKKRKSNAPLDPILIKGT